MKKILTSFFIASLFIVEPALANITPNDPFYDRQWYLARIEADNAWDKLSSSPDVVVAVIDSGIDISHPDLKENIWHNEREISGNNIDDDRNGFIDDYRGWDFVNNIPDPSPKFSTGWTEAGVSHGTMVAGIIAARGNNQEGITGVTWGAKIMPLKVLNDKGGGKIGDVVRAIDYAVNNGADIINLSFMSFSYSDSLQEAVRRAHKAGVIIVAAAGNEQSGGDGYDTVKTPIYPACYDGELIGENMVIGVAATDALDQKTRFSSYGSRCIDIAAPGVSFFSTVTEGSVSNYPNKIYDGYWSGTSMAAPLVSATLALIEQANPELSQREVVNILFASTDDISRLNPAYSEKLGNGRLNVGRAIELAKEALYSRMGRLIIMSENGKKEAKLSASNGDSAASLNKFNFKGVGDISTGDINNDGEEEIILSAGIGQEPFVRIYNRHGKLLKQFLAFDKSFKGGVNLAILNHSQLGEASMVAAPLSNGAGQISIFDSNGKIKRKIWVDGKKWRGGYNIAAGDVDANGEEEIIIGYGYGQAPQVKILNSNGGLLSSFLAYEKKFKGGVKVAVSNLNGRLSHNQAEIIVAPGRGREPLIKIFNNRAQLKKQFLAFTKNWQGGVNLAAGDLNNDGLNEIAVSAQSGAAPHVRAFDGNGVLLESFYAWEEAFKGGVNIGIIKLNN